MKLNDRPHGIIHRIEVWWVLWRHVWCHGLSFSNVCMRPEFMTSMSCDSVLLHMWRGLEQLLIDDAVDQWQMRSRFGTGNVVCFCAFARASGGHFEHTLWPSVCFLCTWWTLCFTPCLTQHIIFKECIINVWYVMFSFSLGSASTLFRWDGHFCHICIKYFFLLTTVQKLFFLKSIKIFQSYDHKMYCYLFMVHSVDSDSCMMLLPWMWLYCWYVWLLSLWICLDM